jgi:OPA family glycerol-3-phosphate transporter-like MFS transporter
MNSATPVDTLDSPAHPAMRRAQLRTIVLLFIGYAACYYCRADLSVATPLLAEELGRHGLSHGEALRRIGSIISYGVLAYAIGKFLLTGLGDYWGGRRNFLIGVGGAAAFTLLFGLSGTLPLFTLAWVGNRLTQSVGWAGLIKVSSRWFDYTVYGSIVGILSISYLIGDALARQQMGVLIAHGYGWRALFFFAAAVAALTLLASLLWLRESRTEAGYPAPRVNPLNLFEQSEAPPAGLWALLRPLLRSRAFLLVCVLSFACTIVRETFNAWTPQYLRDQLGFSMSSSATWSAVFPGVGMLSVLACGLLSDYLGLNGRPLLMFLGLSGASAALVVLMGVHPGTAGLFPVLMIGLVAFFLLGPYSYLGGAFALDFGGRQASAASSGIIDGIGYLGGVLAGDTVARIAQAYGWEGVFVALAIICALAAVCAGVLYVLNTKAARSTHE